MHSTIKLVTRAVVVLAVLALGVSVANAQVARTLTLNCNNMGTTTVTIMSWTWLDPNGNDLVTDDGAFPRPIGVSCSGDMTTPQPVSQPIGDAGATTSVAGVRYTVQFNDGTPDPQPLVHGFVRQGQGVHFRDSIADTNGGKGAAVVIRLAN